MDEFVYRSSMPVPVADLFDWHMRRGALERLMPPWEDVRILDRTGGLEEGTRVVFSVPVVPLVRRRWVSRHSQVIAGQQFKDEQIEGPFAHWVHTHSMLPDGPTGSTSILEDRIDYTPPLGAVGRAMAAPLLRRRLPRLFRYRHETLRGDLLQHARYAARPRLRIAITGAQGVIGRALVSFLTTGGHEVIRLVRRPPRSDDEVEWSPQEGIRDPARLLGRTGRLDACIHLAGESIGGARWTPARKELLRRSRVEGTERLAQSLAKLTPKPAVLLSASGKDFYGYGEQPGDMYEDNSAGQGFLAELCQAWEAATDPAVRAGIRVVHLRLGIVLTPAGGALAEMLPIFRLGAGGPMGHGRQPVSWIGVDDAVGAFHHALQTETLWGPVNVTTPHPVPQGVFASTLGRVLSRPAFLPAPAFALRLVVGEISDALLGGARVIPERLMASGYEFRHPELEPALRHVLGRHVLGRHVPGR